jgi:1-deoxy-D-xylulose-5-phosphate reductoisomerase
VRDIVILGSTGSIGVQALELVAANPDLFRVVGISAGSGNLELLFQQARTFRVPIVGTTAPRELWEKFAGGVAVIDGALASAEIAAISCDIVLNGITGSIGLSPTLSALAAGNKVALANKESLVAGGPLVTAFGRDRVIPVDSEHSALFQALLAGKRSEVKKFVITASGGAFRDRADLSGVTLAEALAHPTWSMGPVVTINSATLMNKGLEVIEAHYLFDLPYSQIEAVMHPQSVIHSMVEYIDGSTIAQLSPPNMKGPIGYALNFPDRLKRSTAPVDWSTAHSWDFAPIDPHRFPALALARTAGEMGSIASATLNAANEVAVAAFINGGISFADIVKIVEQALGRVDKSDGSGRVDVRDLEDVSAVELNARMIATSYIKEHSH